MDSLIKRVSLNSRVIKIIAALTMTVDHIGYLLFPSRIIFRIIGRISMPLFCLLIAYGATKTKSCFKYFLRLLLPAVIFQLVFNYVYSGGIFKFEYINIFFTLALGVLAIWLLKCKVSYIGFAGSLSILVAAYLLPFDFGAAGVLLIILFYQALCHSIKMLKITAVFSLAAFNVVYFFTNAWAIQFYSFLSLIFIVMFADIKLNISKVEKWSFYAYYPLHMVVIYAISLI